MSVGIKYDERHLCGVLKVGARGTGYHMIQITIEGGPRETRSSKTCTREPQCLEFDFTRTHARTSYLCAYIPSTHVCGNVLHDGAPVRRLFESNLL